MIKPKISVIIPVYNTQAYLESCLQSALGQSLQETEFICINDGSTDRSLDILLQYAHTDRRIRILDQENSGLSRARNAGLQAAQGEYLCFLDSDDLLPLGALARMYTVSSTGNLDILLFEYDLKYEPGAPIIGDGSPYVWRRSKAYPPATGEKMYTQMYWAGDYRCPVWGQCFRREFLLEQGIGFIENLIYEDELFTLQALLSAHRTAHLYEPLYLYRLRNGSITCFSPSLPKLASLLRILLEEADLCLSPQYSPEARSCIVHAAREMLKRTTEGYQGLLSAMLRKKFNGGPT